MGEGLDRLVRNEVAAMLSRREFVARAGALGLAATVAVALPAASRLVLPADALGQDPNLSDATLQAFFDTIIPGRHASLTDLGHPIHPKAIAGVDADPGAVEADALLLGHHPKIGFDALAPALLTEVATRSLVEGGQFLDLDYEARQRVLAGGLAYDNPSRVVWEAGAAVPFTAFCAAATQRNPTWATASGLRVMGHPGSAPGGYHAYSYRRKLAKERTKKGYMP